VLQDNHGRFVLTGLDVMERYEILNFDGLPLLLILILDQRLGIDNVPLLSHDLLLNLDGLFIKSYNVLGSHWCQERLFFAGNVADEVVQVELLLKDFGLEEVAVNRGFELNLLHILKQDIVDLATLFALLGFFSFFLLDHKYCVIENIHEVQVVFHDFFTLCLDRIQLVFNLFENDLDTL